MECPQAAPAVEECELEKHSNDNTDPRETRVARSSFPDHDSWLPPAAHPPFSCEYCRVVQILALAGRATTLVESRSECLQPRPGTTSLDQPTPAGRLSAKSLP